MSVKYEELCAAINNNNKTHEIKLDIDKRFVQSTDLINKSNSFLDEPKILPSLLKMHDNNLINTKKLIEKEAEEKGNKLIYFKENEVLEIPNNLKNILDINNYYTFGINKGLSFLDSCFMILDNDYQLQTTKKKKV